MNLDKFSGTWGPASIRHLLSRATFACNKTNIESLQSMGLDDSIAALLTPAAPSLPIHYRFENDFVPIGESWVGSPKDNTIDAQNSQRNRSLKTWVISLLTANEITGAHKMMLFWQNHFAIQSNTVSEYAYQYVDIIRRNAFGNFRTMIEEITVSASMLQFLNGDVNTASSPNENYARELLELFTVGRGPNLGDGDYTFYTETDVVELARALTGWRRRVTDEGYAEGYFVESRHDSTDKQLSHRFDDVVITDQGENEYKTVIDIILQKKETARYLVRQLHIWYIGSEISEEVEQNIIEPLATQLYDDNYEMQGMLTTLFSSNYFYEETHRGCMIASPTDIMGKIINGLGMPLLEDTVTNYFFWYRVHLLVRNMGQEMLNIPSVAGWKAYYQEPQYYKTWINSVFFIEADDTYKRTFSGMATEGTGSKLDSLELINSLEESSDINAVIEELAFLLFAVPITDNQKQFLKDAVIPGLPDFEWTVEYGMYTSDPSNEEVAESVRQKVDSLLLAMMNMAEFLLH